MPLVLFILLRLLFLSLVPSTPLSLLFAVGTVAIVAVREVGATQVPLVRGAIGAAKSGALAPQRSTTLVDGREKAISAGNESMPPALLAASASNWRHNHYAQDCWRPCGGPGLCERWCGEGGACCRFGSATDPAECRGDRFWPAVAYHTCVSAAPLQPPRPPAPPPEAPTFTFYLYRAQNDESRWTLGNVNIANLPGVMWYLSNEVMPRCPKRYGISRIRRYRIFMRATPELYARGMNFGVRYSYDAGKCTGSNIRWLGPCSSTWDRFGYVIGCNNFRDHYPYPLVDTEYPDGVWYDLPLDGRCDSPTGTWNCTWSFEEAGEIRLEDLEAQEPGHGYCCGGRCTDFWRGHWSASDCDRRLSQVRELFAAKFPALPADLPEPPCDFDRSRFWD
mmetsp:Transcript_111262/g.321714  ORF Transcript_111262/g.321714 Transcript_111262/m.321714 type:complete len:392 (+) Transcript_111262:592-1767(+)